MNKLQNFCMLFLTNWNALKAKQFFNVTNTFPKIHLFPVSGKPLRNALKSFLVAFTEEKMKSSMGKKSYVFK